MTASIPAQRRVGRPPLTSPEELLGAARELGFVGLTVGQITAECGVKYSTFYRSWASLDSLVLAMVDGVLTEREWPPMDADWAVLLSGLGVALRDACAAHPGLAGAVRSRAELPPRLRELTDAAAEAMDAAGLGSASGVLVDAVLALALAGVEDRAFGLLLDGVHVQEVAR